MSDIRLTVSKILFQFTLCGIFFYLFGLPAIKKLQANEIIVIERTEKSGGVPAPAITVCGQNNGTGWKDGTDLTSVLESCEGATEFMSCIQSKALSKEDVILDVMIGWNPNKSFMNDTLWTLQFRVDWACYTLNIATKIDVRNDEIINFSLNESLPYSFFIHDPDYFIETYNPVILPYRRMKVFPQNDDCSSYFPTTLTEHHELNTLQDPCVQDTNYRFTTCIKDSINAKVGCVLQASESPNFRDRGEISLPLCTTPTQYRYLNMGFF